MPNIFFVEICGHDVSSSSSRTDQRCISSLGRGIGGMLLGLLPAGLRFDAKYFSITDVSHQALDFFAVVSGEWQQRQTRGAAVVAVEVHGIFKRGNAHLAGD